MTRSGRLLFPTTIRELSPLETVKTFFSPPTRPSLSSLSLSPTFSSFTSLPTQILKEEDDNENDKNGINKKWGAKGSRIDETSTRDPIEGIETMNRGRGEILFTRWDELDTGVTNRRLLILGYYRGLTIWDCTSIDSWFELLNLPTLDTSLCKELSCRFPEGIENIITACVLPTPTTSSTSKDQFKDSRPLLAIITSSTDSTDSNSNLLLYSLLKHTIIHSQSIPVSSTPHQLKVNKNILVISSTTSSSTSSTILSALHIFSNQTLKECSFSPLSDLATNHLGELIFDLGKGGRILAYNSTKPLPSSLTSSRNTTSSPSARNGILSSKGMFDPPLLNLSNSDYSYSVTNNFTTEAGHLLGEASQVTSEVARKMGEGVLNGFQKISSLGRDWLNGNGDIDIVQSSGLMYEGERGEEEEEDRDKRLRLAKSLPLPKNGFETMRRASVGSSSSTSDKMNLIPLRKKETTSTSTILILDLLSLLPSPHRIPTTSTMQSSVPPTTTPQVLAHFKPYNPPLASLYLSPSSSLIFTASSEGYSFDIFELKPLVEIGKSSTNTSSSGDGKGGERVWHRYRLNRGFTSALVGRLSWSEEENFLAVGTKAKGTTHIYAINRLGGKPNLKTHFDSKMINSTELARLSIVLSPITRIRSPSSFDSSTDSTTSPSSSSSSNSLPPNIIFLPKVTSLSTSLSSLIPSTPVPQVPRRSSAHTNNPPWTSNIPLPQSTHYPPEFNQFQDLILFPLHSHHHLSTLNYIKQKQKLTLIRLNKELIPKTAVEQVSKGEVGRLVRGVGASLLSTGSGVIGVGNGSGIGREEEKEEKWEVKAKRKIEWDLEDLDVGKSMEEVKEVIEFVGEKPYSRNVGIIDGRFSAQVEIETFSRSTHVLPKSIYQSQQFDFYALPSNHSDLTKTGQSVIPTKKLEVRSEVRIRPGVGANSATTTNESNSFDSPHLHSNSNTTKEFEPASLEVPIMSAIHTKLEQDEVNLGRKESIYNPTFPNGLPGRQRRWRETLPPITTVHANVNEGLGRMRRELGRVAIGASNMSIGRRRTSNAMMTTSTTMDYSSSISFEEEDAVWMERGNGEEYSESGSTGCTSERDEGEGIVDDDGICWELEGVNGTDQGNGSEIAQIPFEDDEDFFGEKQILISPPTITSVEQDNSSSSSSVEPSSIEKDHQLLGRPNTIYRKKTSHRKRSSLSDSPTPLLCDLD